MVGRCGVAGSIHTYVKGDLAKSSEKGESWEVFSLCIKSNRASLINHNDIFTVDIQSERFAPKIHHHCS